MHPHLDAVCPHGPALTGPWECRAAASRADPDIALRDPVARGQCPCAPKKKRWESRPGSNWHLEGSITLGLRPARRTRSAHADECVGVRENVALYH